MPKKTKVTFDRFFENQCLTDAFNAEMNENWEGIWKYIDGFLGVYDAYFDALFRSVLEKVPADQIFDGLE